MKTLNLLVKQYILDSIDLEVYEASARTPQEAAQKVVGFIMNEADHPYNRAKLVSDVAIIADHIMGLPSYLNIEYSNWEILQLAIQWRSIPVDHTEKQAQKIIDNYPNFIANHLLQIARGTRIKGLVWETV